MHESALDAISIYQILAWYYSTEFFAIPHRVGAEKLLAIKSERWAGMKIHESISKLFSLEGEALRFPRMQVSCKYRMKAEIMIALSLFAW